MNDNVYLRAALAEGRLAYIASRARAAVALIDAGDVASNIKARLLDIAEAADAPERTQAQVLAAFGRAIAACPDV